MSSIQETRIAIERVPAFTRRRPEIAVIYKGAALNTTNFRY